MMALATHQFQGSYCSSPTLSSPWSRGRKLKPFALSFFPVGRNDRFISLKSRSRLSVGAYLLHGPKSKSLKISAFKSSSRHDDSGSRSDGSKSLKNPVKVPYLQHESKESVVESSRAALDEMTARSLAMQNLFKNWLTLLRTPSQTQLAEEVVEEPFTTETSELQSTKQKQGKGEILKAAWYYFWGLDATIKIPLLIFTPLYLTVNVVYGSEVSKELTPLWILGPIIVGLYVKMFRAICSLYVFSFKQTVNIVKNMPAYCLLAYDYIFRGKLKEAIRVHLWKPVVDIKSVNYNDVTKRILKDLQGWLVEKYLDFVESIWPYYCRTIRFLKRANLI
ncbi:uncharacterized protein [Primulina eburnea]|uniref:uncharacterized protein n=1 Tax=Primulina eburnea TaxID=1245227 RepID=UPI003C6CA564